MFTILGADGKEYGPVTAGKLHEWIAAGRADLSTKAKREGEAEWKTLGDFPELRQFGTMGGTNPPVVPPLPPSHVTSAINVTSGTAAALELEPASRWLRLGAVLLDSIIGSLALSPGLGLLAFSGAYSGNNQPNLPLLFTGFGILGILGLAVLGIQIYLLSTRGQTMGKKLLGIKIVNFDDETNPGFVKAFLLRVFVNGVIGWIPVVGWIYVLVDLCFIFRPDRRCLHDLLAGTKVVKA